MIIARLRLKSSAISVRKVYLMLGIDRRDPDKNFVHNLTKIVTSQDSGGHLIKSRFHINIEYL
jgi:hypothetical protein